MDNNLKELFDQKRAELQKCQEERSLSSCLTCPQIFECEVRKDYVKSTYNFLSGGQEDGGFDF